MLAAPKEGERVRIPQLSTKCPRCGASDWRVRLQGIQSRKSQQCRCCGFWQSNIVTDFPLWPK